MRNQFLIYAKAALFAVAIVIGLSGIQAAWSPPVAGTVPPNNSPAVPINASITSQSKTGTLEVGGFLVDAHSMLGGIGTTTSNAGVDITDGLRIRNTTNITCNSTNAGVIKFGLSQLWVCNGSTWDSLTSENDPTVYPFAKSPVPTCTGGQVLTGNGTTLSCVAGGGSGDNLGNHTATTNLDMSRAAVNNVGYLRFFDGSNSFHIRPGGGGALYFGTAGADYNGVEIATSKVFSQVEMRSPRYCITTAGDATVDCVTSLSGLATPPVCTGSNNLHWNGSAWSCDAELLLGQGQTWHDKGHGTLGTRNSGTTYTNSTGRSILVSVTPSCILSGTTGTCGGNIVVDGVVTGECDNTSVPRNTACTIYGLVPSGSSYVVNLFNVGAGGQWAELRSDNN